MTERDAAQIVARTFLRYPTFRPDPDARKGLVAIWTGELVEFFGMEDSENVARWAVEACRSRPSAFPPSLDELVAGMRGAKRDELRSNGDFVYSLPAPSVSEEERERNLEKLRELMDGIGH